MSMRMPGMRTRGPRPSFMMRGIHPGMMPMRPRFGGPRLRPMMRMRAESLDEIAFGSSGHAGMRMPGPRGLRPLLQRPPDPVYLKNPNDEPIGSIRTMDPKKDDKPSFNISDYDDYEDRTKPMKNIQENAGGGSEEKLARATKSPMAKSPPSSLSLQLLLEDSDDSENEEGSHKIGKKESANSNSKVPASNGSILEAGINSSVSTSTSSTSTSQPAISSTAPKASFFSAPVRTPISRTSSSIVKNTTALRSSVCSTTSSALSFGSVLTSTFVLPAFACTALTSVSYSPALPSKAVSSKTSGDVPVPDASVHSKEPIKPSTAIAPTITRSWNSAPSAVAKAAALEKAAADKASKATPGIKEGNLKGAAKSNLPSRALVSIGVPHATKQNQIQQPVAKSMTGTPIAMSKPVESVTPMPRTTCTTYSTCTATSYSGSPTVYSAASTYSGNSAGKSINYQGPPQSTTPLIGDLSFYKLPSNTASSSANNTGKSRWDTHSLVSSTYDDTPAACISSPHAAESNDYAENTSKYKYGPPGSSTSSNFIPLGKCPIPFLSSKSDENSVGISQCVPKAPPKFNGKPYTQSFTTNQTATSPSPAMCNSTTGRNNSQCTNPPMRQANPLIANAPPNTRTGSENEAVKGYQFNRENGRGVKELNCKNHNANNKAATANSDDEDEDEDTGGKTIGNTTLMGPLLAAIRESAVFGRNAESHLRLNSPHGSDESDVHIHINKLHMPRQKFLAPDIVRHIPAKAKNKMKSKKKDGIPSLFDTIIEKEDLVVEPSHSVEGSKFTNVSESTATEGQWTQDGGDEEEYPEHVYDSHQETNQKKNTQNQYAVKNAVYPPGAVQFSNPTNYSNTNWGQTADKTTGANQANPKNLAVQRTFFETLSNATIAKYHTPTSTSATTDSASQIMQLAAPNYSMNYQATFQTNPETYSECQTNAVTYPTQTNVYQQHSYVQHQSKAAPPPPAAPVENSAPLTASKVVALAGTVPITSTCQSAMQQTTAEAYNTMMQQQYQQYQAYYQAQMQQQQQAALSATPVAHAVQTPAAVTAAAYQMPAYNTDATSLASMVAAYNAYGTMYSIPTSTPAVAQIASASPTNRVKPFNVVQQNKTSVGAIPIPATPQGPPAKKSRLDMNRSAISIASSLGSSMMSGNNSAVAAIKPTPQVEETARTRLRQWRKMLLDKVPSISDPMETSGMIDLGDTDTLEGALNVFTKTINGVIKHINDLQHKARTARILDSRRPKDVALPPSLKFTGTQTELAMGNTQLDKALQNLPSKIGVSTMDQEIQTEPTNKEDDLAEKEKVVSHLLKETNRLKQQFNLQYNKSERLRHERNQLADKKEDMEEEAEKIKKKVEDLRETRDHLESELESRDAEFDKLQNSERKLKSEMVELIDDSLRLRNEAERLTELSKRQNAEIVSFKQKAKTAEKEWGTVERQNAVLKTELTGAKSRVAELEKALERAQQTKGGKTGLMIAELETKNKEFIEALKIVKRQKKEHKKWADVLQTRIDSLLKERDNKSNVETQLSTQVVQLETKKNQMSQALERMEQKASSLEQQMQTAYMERDEIKLELEACLGSYESLQKKYQSLEK